MTILSKKISIQNGKKTLHKILTVSKPSHSEVSLIHVAKIDFGKTGEVEDITKKEKGLPHVSFQRKSLWLRTTQNLELRNILSVRSPLYGKKQVAFK